MRALGAWLGPLTNGERSGKLVASGAVILLTCVLSGFGAFLVVSSQLLLDGVRPPFALLGALLLTPQVLLVPLLLLGGAGLAVLRGSRAAALVLGGLNGYGALWTLVFMGEDGTRGPLWVLGVFVVASQLLACALTLACFLRPDKSRGAARA